MNQILESSGDKTVDFTGNHSYTLEEALIQLQTRGEVAIFNYGSGWVCRLSLFVAKDNTGVEFKVASDHHLETLEKACNQCLERVLKAVEAVNN